MFGSGATVRLTRPVPAPTCALLGLAAIAAVVAPSSAGAQTPDGLVTDVDAHVRAVMESASLPGVAVAIVYGDSVLHLAGYGVADRDTGRPVEPGTLFQIGSSSKTFTTVLLGMLVERGQIAFDDPVQQHLPPDVTFPESEGAPVTIRRLALHMAGLPRDPPTLRRAHGDAPVLAFTHFELYQSIERSDLEFEPGEGWQYSNFGFAVLGHALERASGMPYETLLWRELLWPLGMENSTITLWPRHLPRLALPYYPNTRTGELEDYTPWDPEAMSPAGGIASTAEDLAKYLTLHIVLDMNDGKLISSNMLEELHEPQATLNDELSYAYGWFVRELQGVGRIVEHGGEVDGYTSFLGFAPDARVGVAVLTNTGDAPTNDLGEWILRRAVASLR